MKFVKKAAAIVLSSVMALGLVSTVYAADAPHLLWGTEKTYGEDKTQHKPLTHGTDADDIFMDCGDFGAQYAILPKNDTFSFEKGMSNIDPAHNVTIQWECPDPVVSDGKVGLFWEGGVTAKTEKFEFGKEYPVYPAEIQEKTAELSGYGYYTMSGSNEPFVILLVTDYDMNYQWWWIYQVTDNWQAPDGAANHGENANNAAAWESDSKGWWIKNADGSTLTNSWYQSPASGLWYYMGADGYMLTNTTTPDGYNVNADGVWIH